MGWLSACSIQKMRLKGHRRAVFVFGCLLAACLAWPCSAVVQGTPTRAGATYRDHIAIYEKTGNSSDAYSVGIDFLNGICEAPQSHQLAMKWFKKSADKGNTYAAVQLGEMYLLGQGTTANEQEAKKWFSFAAHKGNAKGQEKLGDMYFYGEAGPHNYGEARKWYLLAAEQGLTFEPSHKIGDMFLIGEGGDVNYPEALKWYLKADELGDRDAAVFIATIYRQSNKSLAARWLLKGATQGNTIAMCDLAKAYINGRGIERNNLEAFKWLAVVTAKENNPEAEELFRQTAKTMSHSELANARKQAAELVKKYVTAHDREDKEFERSE